LYINVEFFIAIKYSFFQTISRSFINPKKIQMKTVLKKLCLIFSITIIISSCENKKQNEQSKNKDTMAGVNNSNNKDRKFIHQADFNVETANCLETTNLIEQKTKNCKGFVLLSTLDKQIFKSLSSIINTDSVKKTNYYQTISNLEVRVPDTSLQTFLLYIQNVSTSIKNRSIQASDVTFVEKLNTLNVEQNQNIYIQNEAEKENKNSLIVDNLKLQDDVKYATVHIAITEPEEIATEYVINTDASWSKQTSIGNQAWFQLQKGLFQCSTILIFLLQFWWVAPLLICGKYLYHYFYKFYVKLSLKK
jgi:uncharacterized protein YqfB (UPF0267 family)